MKRAPFLLLALVLLAACSSLATPTPQPSLAPASSPSATARPPSATPSPTLTLSPTPSVTFTLSPSPTNTPPATATPVVKDSLIVYQPDKSGRHVVSARWSPTGNQIQYALSPIGDEYLLKWFSFDLATQITQTIPSPNPGHIEKWAALGLGYPVNSDQNAELQGFASPSGKYLLFPNAAYPQVYTNPNYIFLIPFESGIHERILGPTFRGTVGKAYWVDYETRVIFDYRYANGVLIYLTDVHTAKTFTLADLPGIAELNTTWSVAPNQSFVFIPARGTSQILSLSAKPLFTFPTPYGMDNPTWDRQSQAIYFWEPGSRLLHRYTLGDPAPQEILLLDDLAIHAPVKPTWGMPFAVAPDGAGLVFWHEDWIWMVTFK